MSSEVKSNARVGGEGRATAARQLHPRSKPTPNRASYVAGLKISERDGADRQQTDDWGIRALNVSVAAVLLVLSAPLMVVVALLVRVTSRGPVLYSQERVGVDRRAESRTQRHRRRIDLGGQPIRIYKFRTMFVERQCAGQVWTKRNDRRVTRVGRILRAYRIDELPQLVSVLRRDMNVVGPRPEQPEIFARLRERYERFPDRQKVLPGITGLAQVRCGYGGDDFQMRRKLECDLEYVEGRSLIADLKILVQTVPVVLTRRGAR